MNRTQIYAQCRSVPPVFGFTVWELLIVLVMLGVIAAVIVPQCGGFSDERAVNAARLAAADLEFAQLRSMSDGTDPCLFVLEGSTGYRLARISEPSAPIPDPSTGEPYRRVFGNGAAAALAGVTVEVGGGITGNRLSYTALGALDQGADAKLVFHCAGHSASVTVYASTGEPNVSGE